MSYGLPPPPRRSPAKIVGTVLGFLSLAVAIGAVLVSNELDSSYDNVDLAWSNVRKLLRRRCEIIPSLIVMSKLGDVREQPMLEQAAQLQSEVSAAGNAADAAAAARRVDTLLEQTVDAVTRQPELVALPAFRDAQEQLDETAEQLVSERQRYNEAVRAYNVLMRTFPYNLMARVRDFAPRYEPWEFDASEMARLRIDSGGDSSIDKSPKLDLPPAGDRESEEL